MKSCTLVRGIFCLQLYGTTYHTTLCVTRKTIMSSTFVCLYSFSLLLTDSHPIQNTISRTSCPFLSPPAPQNTTFLTPPSLSRIVFICLIFLFLAKHFQSPPSTCVLSFSPHPDNNIWPSFSSLCTYCCSFLSSDTIVPRSDWTSDMGNGFTLKIQNF